MLAVSRLGLGLVIAFFWLGLGRVSLILSCRVLSCSHIVFHGYGDGLALLCLVSYLSLRLGLGLDLGLGLALISLTLTLFYLNLRYNIGIC